MDRNAVIIPIFYEEKKIVKVAFGLLMVNQYVIFIADVKQ